MKAIFLLICRSRFHVPRVGGFIHSAQFAASTHPYHPFVFEGRAFDMDEFNVAATRLLDIRNQNLGYEVSVRMVPDEPSVEEIPVASAEDPASPVEQVTKSQEVSLDEIEVNELPAPEAPIFRLDGKNIYLGESRIGGLFGDQKQLRVASHCSELRAEIEDWLLTLNLSEL